MSYPEETPDLWDLVLEHGPRLATKYAIDVVRKHPREAVLAALGISLLLPGEEAKPVGLPATSPTPAPMTHTVGNYTTHPGSGGDFLWR